MKPGQDRSRTWIAFVMAWAAGSLDAVGYLRLAELFTAHMSGNSAALGAYVGQGEWREAVRRGFPIPLFVVGTILGAVVVDLCLRRRMKSPLRPAYALQAILILTAMLWARAERNLPPLTVPYVGVAGFMTVAMGIQNSTLQRVGKTGVRTTFVSGMLTNFGQEVAAVGLWLRERSRGRGVRRLWLAMRVTSRRQSGQNLRLFGGIWLAYMLGAIAGSVAEGRWHWGGLILPLVGLAGILAVMQMRDIAGESQIEDKAKKV